MILKRGKYMKIIALWGKKGGVGRTTLSLSLASAFNSKGYKVVVYDADPQLGSLSISENGKLDFLVFQKDRGNELKFQPDIMIVDCPAISDDISLENASLFVTPVRPSPLDMASLNKALNESELEVPIVPVFNEWMSNREEHNKFVEKYPEWARVKSRNVFERLNDTGEALFGKEVEKWSGYKGAREDIVKLADEILENLDMELTK